jgi:ribosomal protein S24E
MSKFIVVKEAPAELKKGEYLIDTPSFLPQIALHKTKVPRNGLTGSHYIRMIVDSIAQAYDPENMTAYSVKAHLYEGRKFSSEKEMNDIVLEMLRNDYPAVFAKYLDTKIRTRPSKTELVIYVDSDIKGQYELFYKNGLSEVEKEQPKKEKSDKVVGKPAVTKEQAEALKNQADS